MPVPRVAEELFALKVLSAHEPLPEGGVEEHEGVVRATDQETGEGREAHQELAPLQRDFHVGERVDRVVEFHGGQGDEGGERGRQDVLDLIQKPHLQLQYIAYARKAGSFLPSEKPWRWGT